MAGGSGGPPKLDGRNYAYWKARMAGYLKAINHIAWAVTVKASRPLIRVLIINGNGLWINDFI